MDWYFGRDIEDLCLPKDKEMSDRLPSPYISSPCEKEIFGSFNSPKKHSIAGMKENLLSGTTFSREVDRLCSSSVCIGLQDDFCQRSAYPHEQLDFQLNDFARFDEADDTFLDSLLEESESGIHAAGSVNFSRTSSNDNMMPSNLLREIVSESNIGHSKDLKMYTTSVSRDCKNEVNEDPFSVAEAMEVDIPFSLEHNSSDTHIAEEVTSLEESVYVELRSLTVQLTESTRICLRDALYRLAENSKHEDTDNVQDGHDAPEECSRTTYCEASRLGDTEEEEPTNAIDRTVANLLFNHINFCSPASTETEDEVNFSFYNYNPCFSTNSHGIVLDGDAEVPTFGLMNHPPPTPRDYAHFSPIAMDLLPSESRIGA